jgi:hypothetical protein
MSGAATTRVDVEEIQTTKSEKLLAVVLTAFLLIGGVWTYDRLADWAHDAVEPSISAQDEAAVRAVDEARARVGGAMANERRTLDELVVAREAYRTALDADEPAGALRVAYEQTERAHERAQAEVRLAQAAEAIVAPAGAAASARMAAAYESAADNAARLAFALRLALVGGLLAAGFWLLGRVRRAGSRWFPLAMAVVAFATLLGVVFAGDYVTDYVDPLDLGPLVLSLLGIGLTLVGFAALQRYLARRIPARRVRKAECAFCGYPVGTGAHCEGCGRAAVAPCARCSEPRRVGTAHCRACGLA